MTITMIFNYMFQNISLKLKNKSKIWQCPIFIGSPCVEQIILLILRRRRIGDNAVIRSISL